MKTQARLIVAANVALPHIPHSYRDPRLPTLYEDPRIGSVGPVVFDAA
jgi:hypothetical protein